MPDTPEDVVKEARELLRQIPAYEYVVPEKDAAQYVHRVILTMGFVPDTTLFKVQVTPFTVGDVPIAEGFARAPELLASLCGEVERLRTENADLVAASLSNLLGEIKSRLTLEEGEQFQSLLMSATKGWVDEITERTAVDRGLLDAFKDLPKKRKRRTN